MYVYIRSEPQLWTVGFYDPSGKFQTDSDHESPDKAAERASELNGNSTKHASHVEHLKRMLKRQYDRILELESIIESIDGEFPQAIHGDAVKSLASRLEIQEILKRYATDKEEQAAMDSIDLKAENPPEL